MKLIPKYLNDNGDEHMKKLLALAIIGTMAMCTGCDIGHGSSKGSNLSDPISDSEPEKRVDNTVTSSDDSFGDTTTTGTVSIEPDDGCSRNDEVLVEKKPIIYIYAKEDDTPVDISIRLNSGKIYSLYPQNQNILGDNEASWSVLADKDGTLVDLESGRELYSLYWEGIEVNTQDIKTGYCVAGKDTEEFLYNALKSQGLTDTEAEEFIIFWLPQMQYNEYNLISFDNTEYNKETSLEVSENVDTMIRVNMRFKPSDKYVELEPETYETPDRNGFTVVEWGGTELK